MSGGASGRQYSDAALSAARGAQAADNVVRKIHLGTAQPDELHEALGEILATAEAPRLRSFCRALSKAIERARASA